MFPSLHSFTCLSFSFSVCLSFSFSLISSLYLSISFSPCLSYPFALYLCLGSLYHHLSPFISPFSLSTLSIHLSLVALAHGISCKVHNKLRPHEKRFLSTISATVFLIVLPIPCMPVFITPYSSIPVFVLHPLRIAGQKVHGAFLQQWLCCVSLSLRRHR